MEERLELDAIDRKLLFELDRDGRASLSAIAKKIRVGRDVVNYRLDRLRGRGVLRKCSAIINPYKLGFTVYKVYLRLESSKELRAEFLEHLYAQPRTFWLAECHGRFDVIHSTFARNSKEFHEMHTALLSKFSDLILAVEVYTLVDVFIFQKTYLRDEPAAVWALGGVPETTELDELELSLLELVVADARLSYTELADRVDSTPAIVKYRLEKLESAGVIVGYRTDLDLERLGMIFVKAQLQLRSGRADVEEQLHGYAHAHPNVTYYIRQIGHCSTELEIEVSNFDEYYKVVDDLREKFADMVQHIDHILLRRELFRWKPHDLVAA